MDFGWSPHGVHRDSTRTPWGLSMDSMDSMRTLWGLHVDSMRIPWGLLGDYEDSTRTPWGLHGNPWGTVKYSQKYNNNLFIFHGNFQILSEGKRVLCPMWDLDTMPPPSSSGIPGPQTSFPTCPLANSYTMVCWTQELVVPTPYTNSHRSIDVFLSMKYFFDLVTVT